MAACLLLAVAVYLPLSKKQEILAISQARLAEARAEAVAADALKQRVISDSILFLLRRVTVRDHPEMFAGVHVDGGDPPGWTLPDRQTLRPTVEGRPGASRYGSATSHPVRVSPSRLLWTIHRRSDSGLHL